MEEVKYESKFRKLIKEMRKARGMSIKDVAEKTGISRPYISQLEAGNRDIPTADKVIKLADALDINREVLLKTAGYEEIAQTLEGSEEEKELRKDLNNLTVYLKLLEYEHERNFELAHLLSDVEPIDDMIEKYEVSFMGTPLTYEEKGFLMTTAQILIANRKNKILDEAVEGFKGNVANFKKKRGEE